jgi:hypothetical protein
MLRNRMLKGISGSKREKVCMLKSSVIHQIVMVSKIKVNKMVGA